MTTTESPAIATALLQRAAAHGDGADVADAVAATWRDIDAALAPVLGQRGVAALYTRSLHQAARTHPWMMVALEEGGLVMDTAPLVAMFREQAAPQAAAGAAELLQHFRELLASLVGPALTERLLRSAWATLFSGSTAQDSTS